MKKLIKYLFFRIAIKIFLFFGGILKKQQLSVASKLLSFIFYILPFPRKKVAYSNLKIAFSKYDKNQIKNILKKFIQQSILTALEVAFAVKRRVELHRWAEAKGLEYLENALKKGKGVIALSAHLGNFPLLIAWLAERGYPVAVLYKEGKYLSEGFLHNLISSFNIYPLAFKSDEDITKEIIKALNKNMIVFLLADQARKGVYAKFFGKLVQCQKGAFVIAQRKGSPLIPAFIVRDNDIHKIIIYPEMKVNDDKKAEEKIIELIEKYNLTLENLIKLYPTQYYWFHRRFKRMLPH
ncbi:MAG: lysophospholipid acyltransferase family protein [Thermodesulfovibrionaceae bacterium]